MTIFNVTICLSCNETIEAGVCPKCGMVFNAETTKVVEYRLYGGKPMRRVPPGILLLSNAKRVELY